MRWTSWLLIVGLLWIHFLSICVDGTERQSTQRQECLLKPDTKHVVVPDNFNGWITATKHLTETYFKGIFFVQINSTGVQKQGEKWPQIMEPDNSTELHIFKWHINRKISLYVLKGQCNETTFLKNQLSCVFNHTVKGPCQIRCLKTDEICKDSVYNENKCWNADEQVKNKYIINTTAMTENCWNCNNPVKEPEERIQPNTTIDSEEGETVDAAQAAEVMDKMANLAASFSGSSALLTVGDGISGVIVKHEDPLDFATVSFAYSRPKDNMSIIESKDALDSFTRSVTVSKEAFEKALESNISVPFAAVLRFFNLSSDEKNSTVLGDEVLAVEMGTVIANLSDKMAINFKNVSYEGYPSCHSWNGEGHKPNWTNDGCVTIVNGSNITCECSHLTFFAILLAPLNETISSSDLDTLTIITQVGCGVSIFFLCIILFMHFLLRRTKANLSTHILIHLVVALVLLNLTFLVNNYVAELKSAVGCKIMAAVMHYSMLATFTLFAVQAFHLCLQLYVGGKVTIRHYLIKVSVISWALPAIVVAVLLILGKYGEQAINTSDSGDSRAMCWMTDNTLHYVVNIGYYALVFLFTFTTFIIIMSWLFCLKKTKTVKVETGKNSRSIVTIMGLCCILGVSWGFAFFAYGPIRIPAYYIFTILNSFQGFFLFIYYWNTSHSGDIVDGNQSSGSTSISTLKTTVDCSKNPYANLPGRETKPQETNGN